MEPQQAPIYIYMYVCMYVSKYVCMYVYIFIYYIYIYYIYIIYIIIIIIIMLIKANPNRRTKETPQGNRLLCVLILLYMCPHTTTYLYYMCVLIIREKTNRRTKETPKGNNRCRQCKEERYFPKDLVVKNPLADLQVSVFVLFYLYFSTSKASKLNPLADLQVSLFALF